MSVIIHPHIFNVKQLCDFLYTYTTSVANQLFNYKQSIRDFKLNEHESIKLWSAVRLQKIIRMFFALQICWASVKL